MENQDKKVELFESYEINEIEDRRELFGTSDWFYWCSDCSTRVS